MGIVAVDILNWGWGKIRKAALECHNPKLVPKEQGHMNTGFFIYIIGRKGTEYT